MRATVAIIGTGCLPCFVALAASERISIPIIVIDDQIEPGAKNRPLLSIDADIVAATDAVITFCDSLPAKPVEIRSNREERRRQQPFYRGLKKYRKP